MIEITLSEDQLYVIYVALQAHVGSVQDDCELSDPLVAEELLITIEELI